MLHGRLSHTLFDSEMSLQTLANPMIGCSSKVLIHQPKTL